MFVQKRKITAAEEVEEVEVEVAPEATDILFEAEDVAELLAEVTEQVVEVNVDGDDVVFNVGEDEFVVTPDEDAELVETSTKTMKRAVRANRRAGRKVERKAPVAASRAVRKIRK